MLRAHEVHEREVREAPARGGLPHEPPAAYGGEEREAQRRREGVLVVVGDDGGRVLVGALHARGHGAGDERGEQGLGLADGARDLAPASTEAMVPPMRQVDGRSDRKRTKGDDRGQVAPQVGPAREAEIDLAAKPQDVEDVVSARDEGHHRSVGEVVAGRPYEEQKGRHDAAAPEENGQRTQRKRHVNQESQPKRGQTPHHMRPARPRQPCATGTGRPAYATMAVPRLPITSWRRAMSITFLASTRVGTSMRRRSPALLTT